MNLQNALIQASERIRSGLLSNFNEAQIKQSVILPILRALDWDDSNPAIFLPEYSVGGGRVDYALCRENGPPLVFIEAKRLGNANSDGEEQLFKYAYGQGVPFLILTDGEVWDFYLSMAEGIPAERRFYKAELRREEKIPEYAKFFMNYLQKERIYSVNARQEAEALHTNNRMKGEAKRAIHNVWQGLLKSPDEMLRDLLVEAVESECGIRPEIDDVEDFLLQQQIVDQASPNNTVKSSQPHSPIPPQSSDALSHKQQRLAGFVFEGRTVEVRAGYMTLAEVLKEFHQRDPTFMARFAAKTVGRTRRLVAQNPRDLYDANVFVGGSLDLGNGWWMTTSISTKWCEQKIRDACAIAKCRFGKDLTLIKR